MMHDMYVVVEFNRAFLIAMRAVRLLSKEESKPYAVLTSYPRKIASFPGAGAPRQSVPQTVRRAPSLNAARLLERRRQIMVDGYLHSSSSIDTEKVATSESHHR